LRKFTAFLNILMGSFFGVFVGNTISNYREYRSFPEIYDMRSAPWYCYGALPSFYLFIAVVGVCTIIKLFIRFKAKDENDEHQEVENRHPQMPWKIIALVLVIIMVFTIVIIVLNYVPVQ